MAQAQKVYDYKADQVQTLLVDAFKKRNREATVADLVAATALPRVQVEEQIPAVADEFGARLRVTESGEVLYSFPRGMRSNKRGFRVGLRKFLKEAGKVSKAILTWLFKAWIVVMLVGYFALFLLLLLVFIVGGFAVQASGRDDRRRSNDGGGLIASILDLFIRIWFYSELFKTDEERYYEARRRAQRRPLHKAVFSFVFGEGDPNADWPTLERKALIAWLRSHRGIITLPEFMALSGRCSEDAQAALNAYCLEFEGSPEASDEGVVYWKFSSILKSADAAPLAASSLPDKREEPFSANPKKANGWFAAINGVNLVFGSFFLLGGAAWAQTAAQYALSGKLATKVGFLQAFYIFAYQLFGAFGAANPGVVVAWALGAVPIAFAVAFYLIPLFRNQGRKARNLAIERENGRRRVWSAILAEPSLVTASSVSSAGKQALPLLEEAAAEAGAEVEADQSGSFRYRFDEVKRAKQAAFRLRSEVGTDASSVGKTVFDTDGRVE